MAQVTCKFLKFDGVDDQIEFADDALYDVASAISFHFWYMRDYGDSGTSALFRRASTIRIEHEDDRLKVTVQGVTPVYFGRGFPVQDWHAVGIAIVESGTSLLFKMYYRGLLYETVTVESAALPAAAATAFFFGSSGAANWFKGRMTNVYVTADEITAAEMASIYALGMTVQDEALVDADIFAIPFDEGTGTTFDNDGVAGLDGTAAGTPVWAVGLGLTVARNPMKCIDQSDQFHGLIWVNTIEWLVPTATTHLVEVTDWAGNPVMSGKCPVINDGGGQKLIDRHVDGIKIPDLDSGYLLIQLV